MSFFLGILLLLVVALVAWQLGHASGYAAGHERGFRDGCRPTLPAGFTVYDGVKPYRPESPEPSRSNRHEP